MCGSGGLVAGAAANSAAFINQKNVQRCGAEGGSGAAEVEGGEEAKKRKKNPSQFLAD